MLGEVARGGGRNISIGSTVIMSSSKKIVVNNTVCLRKITSSWKEKQNIQCYSLKLKQLKQWRVGVDIVGCLILWKDPHSCKKLTLKLCLKICTRYFYVIYDLFFSCYEVILFFPMFPRYIFPQGISSIIECILQVFILSFLTMP